MPIAQQRLQDLYKTSAAARTLLDHFAGRQRGRNVTEVDSLMESTGLDRWEVIHVLKALDEAGCGQFLAGRRGHQSRFQWAVSLVDAGKAAKGVDVVVEPLERTDEASSQFTAEAQAPEAPSQFEHQYQLRPGYRVVLTLPIDLTVTEANRLATFIKTLPLDQQAPSSAA